MVRSKLDQALPFANMRETPYYRDAIYEQFSKQEYARRYAALRAKMREHKLDCHHRAGRAEPLELRRRHAVAHRPLGMARARAATCVVPLDGEPTHDLLDGRHACRGGAPRRSRSRSRTCATAAAAATPTSWSSASRELKLERGRIGLMEIDPRHKDYLPVNQYNVLRDNLPDAELVFTKGFMHELLVDPQRGGARLRAQGRQALPGRHGGDGGARASPA